MDPRPGYRRWTCNWMIGCGRVSAGACEKCDGDLKVIEIWGEHFAQMASHWQAL